jgi:uncharacterized protein (TIGR04255 family)
LTSEGTGAATHVTKALPFPDSPRVLYANNPLAEVICQIRFPAILKIDSQIPSNFQEKIREFFPLLSEEEDLLSNDVPQEILEFFKTNISRPGSRRAWKFLSEDTKWTISLTRDFISLSTEEYIRWEDFREKLELAYRALQEEYHPSFISRTGLRYKDLILRSKLGLENASWAELLKEHIAAEYSVDTLANAIREVSHVVLVEFPDDKLKLGLRHGTARREGAPEIGYLIDCDFYTDEKTEVTNVLDRLDFFNRMAGRLFRWCISDRLHQAMEPRPL